MSCSCGCCGGVRTQTPTPSYNRPGLSTLDYRAGTHGRFRESMIARLSSRPALTGLTTREPDDPAVALLDCWAVIGDVLAFYTERIANEGYLRTATEPESLAHLGTLVGYAPRPSLAAGTYLAYTLDPGSRTVIPAGSGAKSVAAQDELPQTYETADELIAREEWNTLRVRLNDPPKIDAGNVGTALRQFHVEGTSVNLKAGDILLFLFDTDAATRVVAAAKPDYDNGSTLVTLAPDPGPVAELISAVAALTATIDKAVATYHVPQGPFAATVVTDLLTPLRTKLAGTLSAEEIFTGIFLPDSTRLGLLPVLDAVRESGALARVHEGCAVTQWFTELIAKVLDAGDQVVLVATEVTRRDPAAIATLRRLARDLICPPGLHLPGDGKVGKGGCGCGHADVDCEQATALVALTPILPWLRRPPSRPPRRARDLGSTVDELFRPDSDVHPKLLIAADPVLGPNLHKAWANQRIAKPLPLSGVQALRTKAKVTDLPGESNDVWLDGIHDDILVGSWVVVGDTLGAARVTEKKTDSLPITVPDPTPSNPNHTKTVGSTPVTVLVLDVANSTAEIGETVWAHGDSLTALGVPITKDVKGKEIELGRTYDGLRPGRWLIVSGERTDVPFTSGVRASELTMVAGIRQRVDPETAGDSVHTFLALSGDLAYTYRRGTVRLYGNVVEATQGETRREVLGSGNAGQANQIFPLRQASADNPLTWLPADNPLGAENTVTTRVAGVRWHETDGLIWAGPTDHSYTVTTGIDKSVSVRFGDGVYGARVPTGTENVTATYRVGAGRSGNVAAGSINQLASRPLGVNAVVNPLPATGGADGDGPGDARRTMPLRMLALDRLVSVRDYEDFTMARAGIGKVSVAKLLDGARQVVHVTIAGIGDVRIDPLSEVFGALESSLTTYGDLGVPVTVAVRDVVLLVLKAGVKVLPDYSWDLVEPEVRAALAAAFGFSARQLGAPAYLSQAIAAMQAVPGVDYVDVDVFAGVRGDVTPLELVTAIDGLHLLCPVVSARKAHFVESSYEVVLERDGRFETLSSFAFRYGLTVEELVRLNPGLRKRDLNGQKLTVARGIRPAQLAVLPAGVPETLTLRRIP